MRKIPEKQIIQMANDPFYKKCCIADETCSGRLEYHHNLIYAGRQVNEPFCILPLCHFHHEHEKDTETGEHLDYIMLCRATDDDLRRFSKAVDYLALRYRLGRIYG